ncbi:hypothetical protein OD305_003862 [Salmonella enterica]|nr:hypothetical protein [Salmonella enterica]EJX3111578.1 hypothetical protein [Salmonella enterica]EJX3603128.1 hypothetical protein [Salmonella enterica]
MPLPLRDYYPIGRAAELLECTIDDLVHWAMVGCIRLYIKIDHAYGLLNEVSLDELPETDYFDVITEGTKYKNKLIDLDKSIDKDCSDDFDYSFERAKIIHDAMGTYKFKHGNVKCFDEINMRHIFSKLEYYFCDIVSDDFSEIISLKIIERLPDGGSEYDNIKKSFSGCKDYNVDYIVRMVGFFGLGGRFFEHYDFKNQFLIESNYGFENPVYMPESKLCIDVITDSNIEFNISDLFIFKNDFIAIQEALKNGSDLNKKYPYHRISNNHGWWSGFCVGEKNKERIKNNDLAKHDTLSNKKPHIKKYHSENRESVLKAALFVKENYPESCKNYTKWAGTIHEHAYTIFGGDCPLSFESTKRLLGKVTKKQQNRNKKTMS